MKQAIIHNTLILTILLCMIAPLFQCYTMNISREKSNKRIFGEKHRKLDYPFEIKMIIPNEPQLYKTWGRGKPCKCGLNKEDFDRYVAWKTEGISVDHIEYRMKKHMDGKKCVGWAIVFTKKEVKDGIQ